MLIPEGHVKCSVCPAIIKTGAVVTAFGECLKCKDVTIIKIMGPNSRFKGFNKPKLKKA